MTLEEFAKKCGVTIVDCGRGWTGKYGFKEIDWPNCTTCGFRTESAAYKRWLIEKFGPTTAKVVLKLLKGK
jgi:hypothetical protein